MLGEQAGGGSWLSIRAIIHPSAGPVILHGPGVFVLYDRLFLMSGSCLSVEGQDALVIAAVVAASVGDVGKAGAAEGADGEVADGSVGIGLVLGADPLEVRRRAASKGPVCIGGA